MLYLTSLLLIDMYIALTPLLQILLPYLISHHFLHMHIYIPCIYQVILPNVELLHWGCSIFSFGELCQIDLFKDYTNLHCKPWSMSREWCFYPGLKNLFIERHQIVFFCAWCFLFSFSFLSGYIHCTGRTHCHNSKKAYIVYWLDCSHQSYCLLNCT
jgi:hypothetical protein